MLEDEERLDSFDKFGRNFVRNLQIRVEDVGANASQKQKLMDVLSKCFAHSIRLSNTVTGCNATSLSSFIAAVGHKIDQIGESQVQEQNNTQDEGQDAVDKATKAATKALTEEVLAVYAAQLASWREVTADATKTYH